MKYKYLWYSHLVVIPYRYNSKSRLVAYYLRRRVGLENITTWIFQI